MAFDDEDDPIKGRLGGGPAITTGGGRGRGGPGGDDDGEAPTAEEEALEDGVPDFNLFAAMFSKKGVSAKTIRKGEKDFESHGTRAQDGALEASRAAMEEVLSYTRIHKKGDWVRAWYFPDRLASLMGQGQGGADGGQDEEGMRFGERVVVVEHERGNWMKDAGRAVPAARDPAGAGRLWLLPEEALYLVERGTLDLWWPERPFEELLPRGSAANPAEPAEGFGPDDYDVGLPLTLQAAYALLIGLDGERGKVTLPKYQVYTHLKRGGFHVLRSAGQEATAAAAAASGAVAQPFASSLWEWIGGLLSRERQPKRNSNGPLVSLGLYRAYLPIYQQLLLVPRHKPLPVPPSPPSSEPQDPYKVFYHVWKASGQPFSKRSPRVPDFRIAVTDVGETPVPDLEQITALLESTPYAPPPESAAGNGRLYQRLNHGHRNVLVAVVDRGLVNFMRFGEGNFGDERLFERFDNKGSPRGGGKRGGARGRGGGRGRGRGRGGKR